MNATLESPALDTTSADDDFVHIWCCDENLALCGTDLGDAQQVAEFGLDEVCAMCTHITTDVKRCPRCGELL